MDLQTTRIPTDAQQGNSSGGETQAARYGRSESRLFAIGVVLLLSAMALWAMALNRTDVAAMGNMGLVSILPWQFYTSLAVLTLSFSLLVRKATARILLGGHLAAAVLILHGTPAILYGTLRYAWAWKHLGVIDYIQRHGALDTSSTYLNAYQNWPGLFAWGAFLEHVSGLPDLFTIASWAPVYFNFLNLGALAFIILAFTRDPRLLWLSLWLYILSSWVAQDYFAPQAVTFFLFLVIAGICVHWFSQKRTAASEHDREVGKWEWDNEPDGRTTRMLASLPAQSGLSRMGIAGVLAMVMLFFVAIVYSHQLTPVVGVLALGVLALSKRLTARTFPIILATLMLTWMAFAAVPFMVENLGYVVGEIGRIREHIGSNLVEFTAVSREQVIISYFSRGLSLLVITLAVVGLVRRLRQGFWDAPPVLFIFAALLLLPVSSYGGELLFRIYLFAVPFMAFLAAGIVFPSHRAGTTPLAALSIIIISWLLLPGFLVAYYGKDHQYYMTPQEIAASNFVYSTAPPGSLLIEGSRNYPGQHLNYENFTYVPIAWESMETRSEIIRDPVGTLALWMSDDERFAESYLIITRSQKEEIEMLGIMPPGSMDQIQAALEASPRFHLAFSNEHASVFMLTEEGGSGEGPP